MSLNSSLVFTFSSLILFTYFDHYFGKRIDELGLKATKEFSQQFPEFIVFLLMSISDLFYFFIDFSIYAQIFIRRNKIEAFKGFILYSLVQGSVHLLKIIYYSSRPCFDSYFVSTTYGCTCTFGKPSLQIVSTYSYYFYLYYSTVKKNHSSTKKNKAFYFSLFLLLQVITSFTLVISGQVYLTSIVLSFLYGHLAIILYKKMHRSKMVNYMFNMNVIKTDDSFSSDNDDYNYKKNKYIKLMIVYILFINLGQWTASTFVVINFEENPYHPYSQRVCDQTCFRNSNYLSYQSVSSSMVFNSLLIFLYYFLYRQDQVYYANKNYYKDQQKSIVFFFKRVFIFMIFSLPIILCYILKNFIEYLNMLAIIIVPFLWMQVALIIYILPKTLKRYNVDVNGDFFYGIYNQFKLFNS